MAVKAEEPKETKQNANKVIIYCPCCEQRIFLYISEHGELMKAQAHEGDHKNPIKDD